MNLNQTIEAARNVLRFKHMAVKTEKTYIHWIRRFAFWCKDHPAGCAGCPTSLQSVDHLVAGNESGPDFVGSGSFACKKSRIRS